MVQANSQSRVISSMVLMGTFKDTASAFFAQSQSGTVPLQAVINILQATGVNVVQPGAAPANAADHAVRPDRYDRPIWGSIYINISGADTA